MSSSPSTTSEEFDQLQAELDAKGVSAALEHLCNHFRESGRYHELFEALKMQVRHRLGLPLLYGERSDELTDAQQQQLEEGLLAACREVGMALLGEGKLREGWMYLRPVGDKAAAAEVLSAIELDEENVEEFVEVALNEGVLPTEGFAAVLEHYGTCNSITTYETVVTGLSRSIQQDAAGQLVRHLHTELLATLKADAAQQQGAEPEEETIAGVILGRDWLCGEGAYHIDTTHLASVVRFARACEDPQVLRLALDLTEYGRRLSEQFQYEGDEPFVDMYSTNALYFQALLGENVDEAVEYFRSRAEEVDVYQKGTLAVETYAALLDRLGRHAAAIDALVRLIPAGVQTMGLAPSLLELAEKSGDYQGLIAMCRQRNDLLGFATGLLHEWVQTKA